MTAVLVLLLALPLAGAEESPPVYEAMDDAREVSQTARNLTRVTFNGSNDSPDVSPDGKEIVFCHRDGGYANLFRASTAGGGAAVRVTNNACDDKFPRWTPDGKTVVFSSNRVGGWRIWEASASGRGGVVMISPGATAESVPDISPDGENVAFTGRAWHGDLNAWGAHMLWTIHRGGTRMTQYRQGYGPRWSPDGKRFVFQVPDQNGNEQIYVMNVDGSGVTQLTTGASNHSRPTWSPDGRWIAYSDNKAGNYDIWLLRADGSTPTQLTSNKSYDGDPAWSHDGKFLFFVSNRGKVWEIWRMEPLTPGQ